VQTVSLAVHAGEPTRYYAHATCPTCEIRWPAELTAGDAPASVQVVAWDTHPIGRYFPGCAPGQIGAAARDDWEARRLLRAAGLAREVAR
jgi:hypothetical protein